MTVPAQFIATAYGPPWGGIQGGGTTATGVKLPANATGKVGPPYIVAVDPHVIPLGTKLKIWPNPTGDPNVVWTASDTGGAIKGNRIDFLDLSGRASQLAWGRQPVTVSTTGQAPTAASAPTDAASSATGGASSSGGGSSWTKLLLDAGVLALGAAAIYRGGQHIINTQQRKAA